MLQKTHLQKKYKTIPNETKKLKQQKNKCERNNVFTMCCINENLMID
jgi:hypothetical protein